MSEERNNLPLEKNKKSLLRKLPILSGLFDFFLLVKDIVSSWSSLEDLPLEEKENLRKLYILNGLRAFNALVGSIASNWSIGVWLIPLILGVVLGYFGILFTFPLWSICLLAGVVALVLGLREGVLRYKYLHETSQELEVESLQQTEAKLAEHKAGQHFAKRLLFWEGVNSFINDSQQIFTLAGIIILVVGTVLSLPLHPATLVIAVGAAIGYGVFSAIVKSSQVNHRLQRMHVLQLTFEDTEREARKQANSAQRAYLTFSRSYVETYKDFIERLQKKLPEEKCAIENYKEWPELKRGITEFLKEPEKSTFTQLIMFDSAITNREVITKLETGLPMLQEALKNSAAHQQKLSSKAGEISNLKAKEHLNFNDHDKYRVGYNFLMGAIGGGSFAYVTLGIFTIVTVSTPVLWGIVISVGVLYGISSAYFKKRAIEREIWQKIDRHDAQEKFDQLQEMAQEQKGKKFEKAQAAFESFSYDSPVGTSSPIKNPQPQLLVGSSNSIQIG